MWSRRDQVQAYQFLRRRLVSAVTVADANHPESPSRRAWLSSAVGVAMAALLVAGFAVYGALRPGAATSWRSGGRVIVERESGARFVLDDAGLLHPVLNYASARLFLGGATAGTVTVSRTSLAKVPRGLPIGIDGAPDTLPSAANLLPGPWSACSATSLQVATPHTPRVVAALGTDPSGTALAGGQGVLVSVPGSGRLYLVTDGRRFLVPTAAVAAALGFVDAGQAVPVGLAWVNALPAGPELRFVVVPGAGRPGPRLGSRQGRIGDVVRVHQVAGEVQYFVLVDGGLDRITETEAQLIVSGPSGGRSGQIQELTPADLAVAPQHRPVLTDRGYPARVPTAAALPADAVALCATFDPSGAARVDLRHEAPRGLPVASARLAAPARRGVVADEVSVPPGRACVVRAAVSRGYASSALYLVTDAGIRYPVASQDVLGHLGFAGVTPTPVPASALDLLPVGPALDPAAAGMRGVF